MTTETRVLADAASLARAAAEEVVRLAIEAVAARGRFMFVLAGGSTPKALYSLLAGDSRLNSTMPWTQTHFFWGDERHVPPDHAESNFRMAQETMLAHVPVPHEHIHRVRSEEPHAARAAEEYERTLRTVFGGEAMPRFDLILLGMGTDGHTASLFPGTSALLERQRWVLANWVPKLNTWRITFTAPLINNAANVLFLVAGADKAESLHAVLKGPRQPEVFPSQLVQPADGRLLWLVDVAAGQSLAPKP